MTQPGGTPEGYVPRKYESEVYAQVAGANAGKSPFDEGWHDPARVAGDYSIKSAESYERKVAAEGGAYRAGLTRSEVDYRGVAHERLQAMVHDGTSAEEVDEQGIIVNELGNAFKELTTILTQAVAKEQAGWQGTGADAAFHGISGLAKWLDASGDAAFLTANHYSQTSAAIANAQHAMPEPAGRTVSQSMDLAHQQLSHGDLRGVIDTFKNMRPQAELASQAQQEAAAVLTARDHTLYQTGSTQPIYSPPPAPAFSTVAATLSMPQSGSGGSARSPGSPSATTDPGRTTTASAVAPPAAGGAPAPVTGGLPVTGLPGTGPQGGELTGSGRTGDPLPSSSGAGLGGWSRTPGVTLNPGLDAAFLSPVGGSGSGGDLERGGSARSGGGAPGRSSGRVPTGGTEREPVSGKKSAAAEPGAKSASQTAREGLAGKTGKSGAAGLPGAAAGGTKGEKDKEHKRPGYLVEHDPSDALGLTIHTDEHGNRIAPPVLGE